MSDSHNLRWENLSCPVLVLNIFNLISKLILCCGGEVTVLWKLAVISRAASIRFQSWLICRVSPALVGTIGF